MKTFFRILGIITVLISLATCGMSIYREQVDKEDLATEMVDVNAQLAKYKGQINGTTGEEKVFLEQELTKIEKQIKDQPSESTYLVLQIFLSVLILLVLVFAVTLFRPNLKLTTQLLAVAVAVTLITYFMSPDIHRGEYSGLNSRTLALISGIPVIIAGLFAFGVAKRSTVKQ